VDGERNNELLQQVGYAGDSSTQLGIWSSPDAVLRTDGHRRLAGPAFGLFAFALPRSSVVS
jgi:hypothetical protein